MATAYHRRTLQVHEARSALGEAVHTMRLELAARREETDSLRAANEISHKEVLWQRGERARLIAETEELRERVVRLEQALREAGDLIGTFQNMKAVRWTAWPRRIRHRLRSAAK